MIAPQGFVVLSDYARDIMSAFQEVYEPEFAEMSYLPSFPLQELVEGALKDAFLRTNEFWLYSASGKLHRISTDVWSSLFGVDEEGRSRMTFALFHVGDMKIDLGKMINANLSLDDPNKVHGHMRDRIVVELREWDHDLAQKFATFEGYYLTFPEGKLPPVGDLEMVKIARGNEAKSETRFDTNHLEKLLRREVHEGRLPKREEFRLKFAPDIKIEVFKAVWRSVSRDHPSLSKPGPKQGGSSKS